GVEEIEARHFLVMELVPGETLADRIKRGAIPIEDALPIAKQIAKALEEAHPRGVVHRDLKPANIKVTPDGKVKVLDFGLAKAYEREPADALARSCSPYSRWRVKQQIRIRFWRAMMARTVTDAVKVLDVVAGYDPEDGITEPARTRKDT